MTSRPHPARSRVGPVALVVALVVALGSSGPLRGAGAAERLGAPRGAEFHVEVQPVDAAKLGATWHRGCPVGPGTLRSLTLDYVGFDGRTHIGSIVVAARVVAAVSVIFHALFEQRFELRSLRPESAFGGSDPASMAADNSSGFNCRLAVGSSTPQWSAHAYGEAIDLNPVENPYLLDGHADPIAGAPYLRRSPLRRGMIAADGPVVRSFAAEGWWWGGRWASPDYQHFSATGA